MNWILLLLLAVPVALLAVGVVLMVSGCRRSGGALVAVTSLAFAAFCAFGFLASFEPGIALAWRVGYAALGILSLAIAAGGVVMAVRKPG